MKQGIIILVVVLLLIVGGFLLFNSSEDMDDGGGVDVDDEQIDETHLYDYFSSNLRDRAVEEVGQPIEGFTPQIYMDAFSDLKEEDFDGVKAQSGVYNYLDDELVFEGEMSHSASDAISREGEDTLLDNLSNRLGISLDNTGSVDLILDLIK